jgi:hypothetical protein
MLKNMLLLILVAVSCVPTPASDNSQMHSADWRPIESPRSDYECFVNRVQDEVRGIVCLPKSQN